MSPEITQFGIAGLTLGILFFIVRYFVAALTRKDDQLLKKDDQVLEMTKMFNTTVNNHLDHSNQTLNKLSNAIEGLTKEIKNGHK